MSAQNAMGPVIYRNWIASNSGLPSIMSWEYPVFTDAKFMTPKQPIIEFGPYTFFFLSWMAVAGQRHPFQPAFVLRIHHHLSDKPDYSVETADDEYTGGLSAEDITALMSLCLGARLKAGGANRITSSNNHDQGRPIMMNDLPYPMPLPISSRPILPNALTDRDLNLSNLLQSFPNKPAPAATAFVRAARMYQEAIWIAEATPEISWLLLTSAVETIAAEWSRDDSSLEKMRSSGYSGLEKKLRDMGANDELIQVIADGLSRLWGAGAKFRNFIVDVKHFPPPPPTRPPFAQHLWTPEAIKETMKRIYDRRSKALHSGLPFPASICIPPELVGEKGEYAEVPTGMAVSMRGGTWNEENSPWIYLNTFEYIARNCILNWWKSI